MSRKNVRERGREREIKIRRSEDAYCKKSSVLNSFFSLRNPFGLSFRQTNDSSPHHSWHSRTPCTSCSWWTFSCCFWSWGILSSFRFALSLPLHFSFHSTWSSSLHDHEDSPPHGSFSKTDHCFISIIQMSHLRVCRFPDYPPFSFGVSCGRPDVDVFCYPVMELCCLLARQPKEVSPLEFSYDTWFRSIQSWFRFPSRIPMSLVLPFFGHCNITRYWHTEKMGCCCKWLFWSSMSSHRSASWCSFPLSHNT